MHIDATHVREAVARHLGLEACVAVAHTPVDAETLTAAEQRQLGALVAAPRRRSWLLGRTALKRVCSDLGLGVDTAAIRFPHRRLSLAHSGVTAVAIGTRADTGGLGIDLELRPPPHSRAARFFLTDAERAWIETEAAGGAELLRLWTIKEALFKATVRDQGTSFRVFELADPAAASGDARRTLGGERYCYTSAALDGGFWAVAVRSA